MFFPHPSNSVNSCLTCQIHRGSIIVWITSFSGVSSIKMCRLRQQWIENMSSCCYIKMLIFYILYIFYMVLLTPSERSRNHAVAAAALWSAWKVAGAWFAFTSYSRCKKMQMNCSILRPVKLKINHRIDALHTQICSSWEKPNLCLLRWSLTPGVRKSQILLGDVVDMHTAAAVTVWMRCYNKLIWLILCLK